MQTHRIPLTYMRAGTSKGIFLLKEDLPQDIAQRDQVLLKLMGSPHVRQINGIGNGDPLCSKIAIVSSSKIPGVDVDFLFAQVLVSSEKVSTEANCGNILSGVGPFAIENGFVSVEKDLTEKTVRIYNENTKTVAECVVPVLHGMVNYQGTVHIDGVPGLGCKLQLNFPDVTGTTFGCVYPTGNTTDILDGVEASVVDISIPVIMINAKSLNLSGQESKDEINANKELLSKLKNIRMAFFEKIKQNPNLVIPKIAILSEAKHGGHLTSRYFTPDLCHAAHAVTGALCIASACLLPGTVAYKISPILEQNGLVSLEHLAGKMEVHIERDAKLQFKRTGFIRTAQPLFQGVGVIHL